MQVIKVVRTLAALGVLVALAGCSTTPDDVALTPVTEIQTTAAAVDFRQKSLENGQRYFVEFRAEKHYFPGHPGHNYLVHGVMNADGSLASVSQPVGFNTQWGAIGAGLVGWIGNPGMIDPDPAREYFTPVETFRVPLSDAKYAKLMNFINTWRTQQPVWNIVFWNCSDFTAAAAREVGLRAPRGVKIIPPFLHIRKMRQLNES